MAEERRPEAQNKAEPTVQVNQPSSIELVSATKNFRAGNIAKFVDNWRLLTSDNNILEIITGYHIVFETSPYQTGIPCVHFSKGEEEIISTEIDKLMSKQAITKAMHCDNEFISTVFTRPKKDGSHRLILNLKNLNEYVIYEHFKMKSLQSAAQLLKKRLMDGSS